MVSGYLRHSFASPQADRVRRRSQLGDGRSQPRLVPSNPQVTTIPASVTSYYVWTPRRPRIAQGMSLLAPCRHPNHLIFSSAIFRACDRLRGDSTGNHRQSQVGPIREDRRRVAVAVADQAIGRPAPRSRGPGHRRRTARRPNPVAIGAMVSLGRFNGWEHRRSRPTLRRAAVRGPIWQPGHTSGSCVAMVN
jgi:hypothetical protein